MLKENELPLRTHRELWFELIPHASVEKWSVSRAGEEVAKIKITFDGDIKLDLKPYKEGNERIYKVSNLDVSWMMRQFRTDRRRDTWMGYIAMVINEFLSKNELREIKSSHKENAIK